jgi:hypothetical protein
LEWYNIIDIENPSTKNIVSHDCETAIAITIWTGQFNIVSIDEIIHIVYMQPLFEKCDSVRKNLVGGLNVYSFYSYLVNKYTDHIS